MSEPDTTDRGTVNLDAFKRLLVTGISEGDALRLADVRYNGIPLPARKWVHARRKQAERSRQRPRL